MAIRHLALALTLMMFYSASAQKVKLKKGKVMLDGVEILDYERARMSSELTLYTLEAEEEILFVQRMDNETSGYAEDDYIKIQFMELDTMLESSYGYTFKSLIKKLIKDKVMNHEGVIDPEKAKKFIKKYDENITNRTVRY